MEKNKEIGCLTVIAIIVVLYVIWIVLTHVSEQLEKLDWFAGAFISVIFIGLILLVILLANK